GLDRNQGFDTDTDLIDQAIANIPPQGRAALQRNPGIDLNDPAAVARIRAALAPDVAILNEQIQQALGEGFATAARAAALLAGGFVALGMISSLLLPNARRPHWPVAATDPIIESY